MLFQVAEGLQAVALVFANPTLADLMQRHGVEVMQFLAPTPDGGDKVRRLEQGQMFGHRLAGHVEVPAQFRKRLPVLPVQLIEQLAAAGISQGFEYGIHDG